MRSASANWPNSTTFRHRYGAPPTDVRQLPVRAPNKRRRSSASLPQIPDKTLPGSRLAGGNLCVRQI
jgi:hypothetical protein